ncbi:hypothetical protein M9Y10_035820 [Tritrichomonas musculus]|uniref:Surface antigen BspA-like n=1 Tax=Tritrichomonas musculus TaxID=1915356 RepID=A0ABR2GNR0_9EUKA
MLFYLLLFSNSLFPPEFQELAQKALENSRVKIAKASREDTKLPGYYSGPNYHFNLVEPLTSTNSNDLKGYAAENNNLALVKRKKCSLPKTFVFCDPVTQKLYKVIRQVASDNNVVIYKCEETCIFSIMRNFELQYHSLREEPIKYKNNSSRVPQDDFPFNNDLLKYNYQWDEQNNIPQFTNIPDTNVKYGYGALSSMAIDAVFSFSFKNPKFYGKVTLKTIIGAGIDVPAEEIKIPSFKTKMFQYLIKGVDKDLKFMNLKVSIGTFFNLQLSFEDIIVKLQTGLQYCKNMDITASKYFEITLDNIVDSDWEIRFSPLPDLNEALTKLTDTITSASLTATLDVMPSISFKIQIASASTQVFIGLHIPFKFDFSFDENFCIFPHIKGEATLVPGMFFTVDEIKVPLLGTVFKRWNIDKYYEKLKLDIPSFCIGPKVQNQYVENHKTDSKFTPIEFPMKTVHKQYTEPWKTDETLKVFNVKCASGILGTNPDQEYISVAASNAVIIADNIHTFGNFYNYFKAPSSGEFTFTAQRKDLTQTDLLIDISISYIDGEIQKVERQVVNKITVKKSTTTPIYMPTDYAVAAFLSSPPIYSNQFTFCPITLDSSIILLNQVNEDGIINIIHSSTYITNLEPSVTVDLSFMYDFYAEVGAKTVQYSVYADDTDTIIVSQDNEQILSIEKTDYYFDVIIDRELLKKPITFIRKCINNEGEMCQITYPAPEKTGYHIIKYPNTDGISITGSGFLVEAIPVTAGVSFTYHKNSKDPITLIKEYTQTEPAVVVPKFESTNAKTNDKRVCLYKGEEILPFSRKYFNSNIEELIKQLKLKPPNGDISDISSDENGCITFPSSYLPSEDVQITNLVKEVCDIPIVPISIEVPDEPEKTEVPDEPEKTEIPDEPSNEKEAYGDITLDTSQNVDAQLKTGFQQITANSENTIKILRIKSNSFTFESELEDNQKIKVQDKATITYKSGNLNLALDKNSNVNVILDENNQAKLSVYGSGNIGLQLTEENSQKTDVEAALYTKSDIKDVTTFIVPNNVKSLTIDSVELSSNGQILAKKENTDEIKINVKQVNLVENTISNLQNMAIEDTLLIPQPSQVNLEKVEFTDKTKINMQISSFSFDNFVRGIFESVPKIHLSMMNENNELPKENEEYSIVKGKFSDVSCESWGNGIDYGDSGFNNYVCRDSESTKSLEDEGEKSLYVLRKPAKKKGGNGLSGGAIAGIVIACLVVAAAAVALCLYFFVFKKKKVSPEKSTEEGN